VAGAPILAPQRDAIVLVELRWQSARSAQPMAGAWRSIAIPRRGTTSRIKIALDCRPFQGSPTIA